MNRLLLLDQDAFTVLESYLSQANSHEFIKEMMASIPASIPPTLSYSVHNNTAKIAVEGVLVNRIGAFDLLLNKYYGIALPVTYERIANTITQANHDEAVKEIVLVIDSPGGSVSGIDKAITAIRSSSKPITSEVQGLCASAGYWLASQTKRITASSRLSVIGSIGVVASVVDASEANNKAGLKLLTFRSSHAPNKNLSPQEAGFNENIQKEIDQVEAMFLADVAMGRGVDQKVIIEKFGAGGVKFAEEALAVGMIDAMAKLPMLSTSSQEYKSQREENSMPITEEEHQAKLAQAIAEERLHERDRIQGLLAITDKIHSEAAQKLVKEAITNGKSKADLVDEVLELKSMEATKEHEANGANVTNPSGINPLAQSEVETPQAGSDGLTAEEQESIAAMEAYYKEQGANHG